MWGDIGWREGYINTGVFLTSKQHKDIFTKHNGEYYTDWGSDDVHIGYNINKQGHKIHELDYTFNHMCMFSEPWNGNPDRYKSNIIHYAGNATFPGFEGGRGEGRTQLMRFDLTHLWGETVTK